MQHVRHCLTTLSTIFLQRKWHDNQGWVGTIGLRVIEIMALLKYELYSLLKA